MSQEAPSFSDKRKITNKLLTSRSDGRNEIKILKYILLFIYTKSPDWAIVQLLDL